jgi:DNA-binding GntR family transcriptional regulator
MRIAPTSSCRFERAGEETPFTMNIVAPRIATVDGPAEDRGQAIRDRLRDAIVDRRLMPGTKLSEQEVGALLNVSRTVARSALQMLSFEGLVRVERNRGAFVANPSPDEARQVFASRRLIEPGIIAAACERNMAQDVAALRRHLAKEALYLNERGPRARRAEIKASGEFHLMLAAKGGNAILFRFMEELIARSSLVIALYGRSGTSSCGHDEHVMVVDALEVRDAGRAQTLISHHIDHIEADLDLRARGESTLREALEL